MAKRHSDALAIQQGACNPAGMARALVSACDECLHAGVNQHNDPAVKLIVHQIAFICGLMSGGEAFYRGPTYEECTAACRAEADKVPA